MRVYKICGQTSSSKGEGGARVTSIPIQFQPLRDRAYQPRPIHITTADLERLSLLVPEMIHATPHNQQALALAYIERYQADVLQIEQEWKFLYATLIQAWQQGEYGIVVRLVASLAYIVGRLDNHIDAEYILHLGIKASRSIQDWQHLALFLNRLGGLLFSRGKYQQGRQIWYASLQFVGPSVSLSGLWEPLASFAYIADILGNYTAAQQFVETCRIDCPDAIAVALFVRGFYARHMNDLGRAYEDLTHSLRLLSQTMPGTHTFLQGQFRIVVQSELARVQGDYLRSREYTETALALTQLFGDRYTTAALLLDHGLFSSQHNQFADTHTTVLRLRTIVQRVEALHIYECTNFLEQRLATSTLPARSTQENQEQQDLSLACTELLEQLSEREREVLRLIAEGYVNREIAQLLTITTGTVKKHLEHIYSKLDVHNRTSAVARARALKLFS
jgi:RNA polymerase sigma factor (sigma-70 family)